MHHIAHTSCTDGEECPVGFSWCYDVASQPLSELEVQKCLYTLEELDRAPCDVQLKLSEFRFTSNKSRCPLRFQWQGILYLKYNLRFSFIQCTIL